MRQSILACCVILALGLLSGCSEEKRFYANSTSEADADELAIRKDLANLALGAKTDDPSSSVAYDTAINNLMLRGATIETRLIDTLRSSPDAWIRIGCVEVLTAVATKASIEHLIAVLDDEAPLVTQRANIALQTLTGQRMIAAVGKPDALLLPPVPARPDNDKALDAEERIWTTWHITHKAELKAAWERWWIANKARFTLK